MDDEILTTDEQRTLLWALAQGRGARAFTEDDYRKLIDWAGITRVSAATLDLILSGNLVVKDMVPVEKFEALCMAVVPPGADPEGIA